MKNIIEALNWRYAVKTFDASKQLTDAQLSILTESLRLSASSYGLQPWKFIVVSNPEIRKKLRESAWNQPQITDASHLIVLAVKNIDAAAVDAYMESVAKTRGVTMESLKGYGDMIKGSFTGKSPETLKEWAARQVYIALGTLLMVAAHEEIDACPMEGFDAKKFDEILGLDKLGLKSKVLAAVGYRSAEDKSLALPKSRFSKEEVVIEIK